MQKKRRDKSQHANNWLNYLYYGGVVKRKDKVLAIYDVVMEVKLSEPT